MSNVIYINQSTLTDKIWKNYVGTGNEKSEDCTGINEINDINFDYEKTSILTTSSTVCLASPRLYEIETKEIKGYKAIDSLSTASKDGYTFIGWHTQEDGGEKINENTIIKEDTDFYAHFTKK